jgi:uncharacterized protein (TIGR00251 family)
MIPEGLIRDTPSGAVLAVRVTPRASRSTFQGVLVKEDQPMLRIALHSPPIDGRANEELLAFLSRQLDLPHSSLEIIRGMQSREKLVRTIGVSADELSTALLPILRRLLPNSA